MSMMHTTPVRQKPFIFCLTGVCNCYITCCMQCAMQFNTPCTPTIHQQVVLHVIQSLQYQHLIYCRLVQQSLVQNGVLRLKHDQLPQVTYPEVEAWPCALSLS